MTTDVITVTGITAYKEIATRLRESRVSAFPVLDDDGRVAGVVSAADLLAKVSQADPGDRHRWSSGHWSSGHWFSGQHFLSEIRDRVQHAKAEGTVAADLMTAPAVTIGAGELVSSAARVMSARRIERLPVVGPDGRLAGIISRSDVLSVFRRPDEDIYQEIVRDVIADGFFMDPAGFRVTVENGAVTLEDSPGNAAAGRAIAERARHIEGVVTVHERPMGSGGQAQA
jgi:CBS-domain-containing membrane protein